MAIFFFFHSMTWAQPIDIVIKNGHVYDPKNDIDQVIDIAITDGKIQKVAEKIDTQQAEKVIEASGLWVSPGFIDIHTHVFVGPNANKFANGSNSITPDDFTFRAGITTVVDAGTSGWRNFPLFKSQVIEQSKTRVLAFLNIVGTGMTGDELQHNLHEMDAVKTAETIRNNKAHIVGVKIGHFEEASWVPFNRAIDACNMVDLPLFVECHLPEYSLGDQLARMREGDIITHTFENVKEREPIVDNNGKVLPVVLEARDRGILFDVGHGGSGFWFNQAIPAFKQGFWPNSFGTDMHKFSVNRGMKDMLNVMSKFLNMGMPIRDVLLRASWRPAQAIKRTDLGHLSVGAVADIAIIRIAEGNFGYVDARDNRIAGDRKLIAEMTIRDGKIAWDLNGLSARKFR